MFLTGIDWSEKYLDICVKSDDNVILRERVDNSDSGFNCMVEKFSQENIDFNSATPTTVHFFQKLFPFGN
jgi:hypothetical protein